MISFVVLGVPEEKICVILLAVDDRFCPLETATLDTVREKYGLPDKFMLNVGTIEPRKNILGLVDAFSGYVNDYSGEMESRSCRARRIGDMSRLKEKS